MRNAKSLVGRKLPAKRALLCAMALPAMMALTPLVSAKALVFCSEGSPEPY